jgi:hypothetical protein
MKAAPSLRRSMADMLLPALLAAVLAIVATIVAQKVVVPAIERKGGWYSRWDQSFVGMIGAATFFLAFLAMRRFTRRPRAEERTWLLVVDQVVPTATSYREASPPTVQDLIDRLARHGYQLQASQVAEDRVTRGAADPRTPLAGSMIDLCDARLPRGTRVILHVTERAATEGGGTGTVTAIEGGRKLAGEELALFTIRELGQILPGLAYKDIESALTPDSTEMLAAALPDRPRSL